MSRQVLKQLIVYLAASSISALVGSFVIYGKTESIVQKGDFLYFTSEHFSPTHSTQTFWLIFATCLLVINAIVIAYWLWNK
jgi:hypothetical protein